MELRPYQVEAIDRITERGNLLLAMVMGAGKTAAAVAAIRALRRQRRVDCGVVFAPKSTFGQWQREIERWDPRAKAQIIVGSKDERMVGYKRAWRYHYNIVGYDAAFIHDWDLVKAYLPLDFIVCDEVTALKSFKAKRSQRAKLLGKRSEVRIGLSGQPVENRPEELFSIMEFLDAQVLGPFPKFDRTFIVRDGYGRPRRYRNLHLIRNRLGPAMYRKTRDDIKQWLPEKVEMPMPVPMDRVTQRLHSLIKDDLREAIDKAVSAGVGGYFDVAAHYGRIDDYDTKGLMGQVMARLTAMRMLASHPRLLRRSADEFDSPVSKAGSEYASELKAAGLLDGLPSDNAKLDALLEQIDGILDEDPRHKLVCFTYFKPMLAMIGDRLKVPYVWITGDSSAKDRDSRIVSFNTDPAVRVFLSTDAGAYGIDLNQGSHVINYDLPWSAGALAQRIARIDRTSSGFATITVLHMFCEDSVEERMYAMLQQKLKVAKAFLDGEFDARSGSLKLDLQSLREFLG